MLADTKGCAMGTTASLAHGGHAVPKGFPQVRLFWHHEPEEMVSWRYQPGPGTGYWSGYGLYGSLSSPENISCWALYVSDQMAHILEPCGLINHVPNLIGASRAIVTILCRPCDGDSAGDRATRKNNQTFEIGHFSIAMSYTCFLVPRKDGIRYF
jgi:hypothetical protein